MQAYYNTLAHNIKRVVGGKRPYTLLDYGCGDAWAAGELAASGISVVLYDPVPNVAARAHTRWGATPGVRVVDSLTEMGPGSVDGILIFSVLQYVSKADAAILVRELKHYLAPGGTLYLGDIVRPDTGMIADVRALFVAGFKHGFFFDALMGLIKTFFSDYRRIRKEQGFSTYTEDEITQILVQAGYTVKRLPNLGLSPHRMTFEATSS
ncbi:class I SAM-dependent methyltransferase [Candidatus Nomurabacteria bacterium]|nr:class I SAM-dependent methyltransferase [Candidatus Nomurabacteria bacterium]